jgi:hypothetical protein
MAVTNASTATKARSAARRLAQRWSEACLGAVACLRDDLDELLTCFRHKTLAERKASEPPTPSNGAFARSAAEPAPMGVFQDRTSMDRILFAVFTHENNMQGTPTLLALTKIAVDVTTAARELHEKRRANTVSSSSKNVVAFAGGPWCVKEPCPSRSRSSLKAMTTSLPFSTN